MPEPEIIRRSKLDLKGGNRRLTYLIILEKENYENGGKIHDAERSLMEESLGRRNWRGRGKLEISSVESVGTIQRR